MNQDLEHLRLLSIFQYVVAGLTAVLASFFLIHVAIGLVVLVGGFHDPNPPPPVMGWLFVLIPGFFVLCGWTLALFMVLAGRRLQRHAAWTFCFVVAVIDCLVMPFGTVLGVFTIVVLMRPSVKALFGVQPTVASSAV